jgi:hypothetical protein
MSLHLNLDKVITRDGKTLRNLLNEKVIDMKDIMSIMLDDPRSSISFFTSQGNFSFIFILVFSPDSQPYFFKTNGFEKKKHQGRRPNYYI